MKSGHSKSIILISLFTAFLSISSILVIPIGPVPLTLQVLFFLLIPALLGLAKGTMTILLYLALGLVGMPVFSGGTGGLFSFLSPSFGYLIGAVFVSLFIGKMKPKLDSFSRTAGYMVMALLILYSFGIAYQYSLMNLVFHTPVTLNQIILVNLTVFLPIDLIKVFLAAGIYQRLNVILKKRIE